MKMLTVLMAVLIGAVCVDSAVGANAIIFDNSGGNSNPILGPDNNPVVDQNWLIEVWRTSNTGGMINFGADIYTGYSFQWESAGADGYLFNQWDEPTVSNPSYIYLVVYNVPYGTIADPDANVTPGTTQYSIIQGSAGTQVPSSLNPPAVINPTDASGWSQGSWTTVPVPEPSTVGLMVFGLGIAAFRFLRKA